MFKVQKNYFSLSPLIFCAFLQYVCITKYMHSRAIRISFYGVTKRHGKFINHHIYIYIPKYQELHTLVFPLSMSNIPIRSARK
jgi:hypothetical protein